MLGDLVDVQVPDAVSPDIGWRTWAVRKSFGQHRLVSPSRGTLWPARQQLEALCTHDGQDCHCGVNAWSSLQAFALDDHYLGEPVWGEVSMWGQVRQFESGMRSQYAYPRRLHVSSRVKDAQLLAAQLSQVYGVPCDVAAHPGNEPQYVAERERRLAERLQAEAEADRVLQRKLWRQTARAALGCLALVLVSFVLCQVAQAWQLHMWHSLDLAAGQSAGFPDWSDALRIIACLVGLGAFIGLLMTTPSRASVSVFGARIGLGLVTLALCITAAALSGVSPGTAHQQRIHAGHIMDRVVKTGKAERIQATDANDIAWITAFRPLSGRECMSEQVSDRELARLWIARVCRRGDTVIITRRSREAPGPPAPAHMPRRAGR
jgi:hypothetical protein